MGLLDLFRSKPIDPVSKRVEDDVVALSTRVNELELRLSALVDSIEGIEEVKKRTVRMERFMYRHKSDFQSDDDDDQFKLPFDKGDTSWLRRE